MSYLGLIIDFRARFDHQLAQFVMGELGKLARVPK